jgi:uncharacterized protein
MNYFEISFVLCIGSLFAGFVGALSGLGGGIVIVPLLVLLLHVDMHYAIGASLVAVIATSSGASAAYVKEGYSNIRVGMLLETATSIGAIFGVYLASFVPVAFLYIIFGIVLGYSAFLTLFHKPTNSFETLPPDRLATFFAIDSHYPSLQGIRAYHVQNIPFGYIIMFIAGSLSGLLGIGSGALKVLALDRVMHLPFKVSTTTSNFMIGVTAAASAGLYLNLGYIDPALTMPVVIGVTFGSLFGARLLPMLKTPLLQEIFVFLIFAIAVQMIYTGITNLGFGRV